MIKARAVVMTGIGEPEVLQLQDMDVNWPRGESDVLVRIKAAGLNPADTFFRALGTYVENESAIVLGHDGAGIVEAVGASVDGVSVGDRVCFCHGGIGGEPGTYCDYAVVPADLLVKIPDGIDFRTAAVFPLVAITAWEALVERAGVKPDEKVLIHGGAGGTGQMAIQVARLKGAKVATTVSSQAKADLVGSLGAERPILYKSEDFTDTARDWTGNRGLDVALDNAGPAVMTATYGAMAVYGRVVTLMGIAPDDADLSAYNRNLCLHNVMMLTPMWFGLDSELVRQASIVRNLITHLASGTLKVRVENVYPLEKAADAHRQMEAGSLSGKLVLDMDA